MKDRFTSTVRESMISDFKFVKILLVHQKFSPRLRTCISGKMAFDLIIWGYQSNYESISANDIQPGHCAFFDFENEKDEETKSIQILKLKGKKFQMERQTLKSARKVTFTEGTTDSVHVCCPVVSLSLGYFTCSLDSDSYSMIYYDNI